MKKKLYLNVFLYYLLIAPIMQAFRKIPALSVKNILEDRRDDINLNNQILSGTAQTIAPVYYEIFKPLAAAWFR